MCPHAHRWTPFCQCKVSPCPYKRAFLPVQSVPMPIDGRRSGDAAPAGTLPPSRMDGRGDEHRLQEMFRSHTPGRRAAGGGGARHGTGCLQGAGRHVPAAPPVVQHCGLPGTVVARHQWHPAGMPAVGDPRQRADGDLEGGD